MRINGTAVYVVSILLFSAGCGDKKKWAEERQAASSEAKLSQKAAQQTGKPVPPAAPVDPYWDDASLVRINPDGKCPEGFWALFKGTAPGDTEAERKANEAKRKEYAERLKAARFVTHLRAPQGVKILDYDTRKAQLPLEILGTIDCTDSAGHLAIAFTEAKAITPPPSAVQEGAEVIQNIWEAPVQSFILPLKTFAEGKAFSDAHRFDLTARIVYTIGKTDVDRKMFKQPKVKAAGIEMGGGMEDWGAGRLIRTQVEALRLAVDGERTTVVDTREKR